MDQRDFSGLQRLVVKVGTNVLSRNDRLDREYLQELAAQIQHLRGRGIEVCLVTSGAIGLGARELGLTGRVSDIVLRQACAAVGQPILMEEYRRAFQAAGILPAQVLLTREVLNSRSSYVKLRNAVERLLELGVVPVFNENDSVSVSEIGSAFGDNDRLSALIASKVDAELLILLSDVGGYYSSDPRTDPEALLLSRVDGVTAEMTAAAGSAGSMVGTGGMVTKLQAVRIAASGGCRVVLAHGREERVLDRIVSGEEVGTVFSAHRRLRNKSRWILHSAPRGRIVVDAGALEAIRNHKSLLPRGIVSVEGTFESGDVVLVNEAAKLVSAFSSRELERLAGLHSSQISTVLGGADDRKLIARPEEMVFLEDDGIEESGV